MKNYFYTNEISQRIKDILTEHLEEWDNAYNLIEIGDLSLLPHPDMLADELPSVFISVNSIDVTTANKRLEIFHHNYSFSIIYVYPVDIETGVNYKIEAVKNAERIAGVLTEFFTLRNLRIPPEEGHSGGYAAYGEVTGITFENAETEFFRQLEISAATCIITYLVEFRTYERSVGAR